MKRLITFSFALFSLVGTMHAATITLTQSGWWNQNSTWPGGIRPTENDDVVIPQGITLTLLGTCRAKSITVNGRLNTLDHQDEGTWVDLRTKYIMVMGANASMEIGKSSSYYKSTEGCTITLTGSNPGEKIPGTNMDSKSIMVMGGAKLSMYGTPKKSWVKIGSQTPVGSTSITMAEAIDWNIGDEIVITSNRIDVHEAETRIITSISSDNRTVSFATPLAHPRMGELKSYSNGSRSWTVDTRAEVGILTRNITIQGDDFAATSGYGGHIMIMGGSSGSASNVEFFQMGQKAVLARYPWHWHLLGAGGNGQFLRNCAIHRSFNRAVTIHGTWGTLVDNNVAYDHIGHGIFLEDGSEINNIISNNLVLGTKNAASEAEALLDTDFGLDALQNASPSSFWITNPDNTFLNNVVAGSEGTAYWFAMPDAPTGLSESDPALSGMRPRQTDLKEFSGNVAHSCLSAFDINDRLDNNHSLKANGSIQAPNPFIIEGFTVFANRLALYSGIGDQEEDVIFDNCMSSDNEIHNMFASRTVVRNLVFIADSDNGLLDKKVLNEASLYLYNLYDGAGRIYDSYMVNWNRDYTSLFRNNGAAQKRINHLFRGIMYNHGGTARIAMPSPQPSGDVAGRCPQVWSNVVRDLDGSLTRSGVANSLVNDINFNDLDNLYQANNWSGLQSVSNKYVYMYFQNQPVRVSRKNLQCGSVTSLTTSDCELGGVVQLHLALDEGTYEHAIYCDNLTGTTLNVNINSELNAGDALTVRYKGFGRLNNMRINGLTARTSLQAVRNSSTTAYYVEPNGDLYVKFITTNSFKGAGYAIRWDSGSLPSMNLENSAGNTVNASALSLGACQGNGAIQFSFDDSESQSSVAFSIDGGTTFPYAVNDNAGNYIIDGLSEGTYSTYARYPGSNCYTPTGSIKVGADAYSCKKWEFNTDNDFEGWVTNDKLNGTVSGGIINYEIAGNDPFMSSGTGVNAIASVYPFVRVRIKTSTNGNIEVFWSGGSAFSGGRMKSYPVTASSGFQEVLIPMNDHVEWKDVVDRIRIDLQFPQGQTGEVDLISLEKTDLRDCNGVWEGLASPDDCIITAVDKT